MSWHPVAKWLIGIGLILIVVGLFWQFLGRWIPLGRLPGDIYIEKDNVKFYFPLASCLLVSIVISVILLLISKWKS